MATGAITDTNQVGIFTVQSKHFRNNQKPVLSIGGLAAAETCSLYFNVGGTWEPATDSGGTAIVYTATDNIDSLNSPGEYGFIKDLTSSTLTVYLDDGI
jgi:hypothetical protein